ncbi:unnamed protein product [Closterium sp. NIES-54]
MGVDVYALDFVNINDAIYAMYATEISYEDACYSCVPSDAGVVDTALGASESAAALGASASAVTGASASAVTGASESAASAEALHTFTLNSGASRCFFRDCTTLTPLAAPVPVSLGDPSGGPVVARSSTVLPCPTVPSGSLSGLNLPEFSTNLVSNAALQDVWVDTFILGGQCVAICTCSRTGRHLATFTRQPGSSLYTLTTSSAQVVESGQVAASSRVSASGQLAASCSCRVLSHQTLLWHHRLDHPSLPHLRSMHSRLLVSRLPTSLPSLPRSHAQPCLPCVEGRQRAAPHSSEFPPTTAPLQTLHMDMWGPALVGGMDQERYFLLVVDDYTRYTTIFPLRRKADVNGVLIQWICAIRRQLRERFSRDFPVLRLHSNRGGKFSSDLLAEFCRDKGIHQSFTLPTSPQQNGIALNIWPRVSEPENSPTLRWTGKVGDASVFRVWGALSLVRDAKASKLSSCTLRCVFLGFPTDAPPWQFYHPSSRRVFSSQDVTFDKSGPAPSGVSQVDPPPLVEPLEISSDSSGPAEGGDPTADDTAATRRSPRLETPPGFMPRPSSPPPQPTVVDSRAETAGAELGGAETEGEASGGAAPGGAATGGADSRGAASGGADSGGAASPSGGGAVGDPAGAGQPPQPDLLETLSPQAIRAWIVRRGSAGGGGYSPAGVGGIGVASTGGGAGARGAFGAGCAGAASAAGAGRAGGAGGAASAGGAGGPGGVGGAAGARGAGAATTGGAGAGSAGGGAGAGGAGPVSALRHLLGLPPPPTEFLVAGTNTPLLFPQLLPHSPLPALAPYTTMTESLTEHRELETRASTPEHRETETRASVPARVRRMRRPRAPAVPGTHDMTLRPSSVPQRVVLPSPPASSLPDVADPPSNLARSSIPTVTRFLATVVTDPTFFSPAAYALVAELVDLAVAHRLDYLASLTAMDAEMASWKSTGTYVDEVPPPGANIVSGMWIFRVKRPPGSPPVFKARYVVRGFSQCEGVDFFQTFSPTPKMTTLRVLLHVAAQRDYELHSLDFSTAFLQASLHKAIWLRLYSLRQAPRGLHDTLRTTLAALGFVPSTADPSLFLRIDTTLPPFYVLAYVYESVLKCFGFQYSSPQPTPLSTGHSLSAPPSDKSVEPSGPYPELVGCLICEAEFYAGAMAAQELRLLTYLLTD